MFQYNRDLKLKTTDHFADLGKMVNQNKMKRTVLRDEEQRLREIALSLTHIGQEIMLNSVQRRLDNRTIILERKK